MIGGERGPVTLVAFKAIDSVLRGQNGGFDSHTLPPKSRWICCPSYSESPFLGRIWPMYWTQVGP